MSKPDERIKVIISQSGNERELLDIFRYGNEFYASRSGDSTHSSYHETGRTHTTHQSSGHSTHSNIEYRLPSSKITGFEILASMTIDNAIEWHAEKSPLKKYHGKKVTSLVKIDCDNLSDKENFLAVVGFSRNTFHVKKKINELKIKYEGELIAKSILRRQNAPILAVFVISTNKKRKSEAPIIGSSTVGSQISFLSPTGALGEAPTPHKESKAFQALKNVEPHMQKLIRTLICSPSDKCYIDVFNLRVFAILSTDVTLAPIFICPIHKIHMVSNVDIEHYFERGIALPAGEINIFDLRFKEHMKAQFNIEGNHYQISILNNLSERINPPKIAGTVDINDIDNWRRIFTIEMIKLDS